MWLNILAACTRLLNNCLCYPINCPTCSTTCITRLDCPTFSSLQSKYSNLTLSTVLQIHHALLYIRVLLCLLCLECLSVSFKIVLNITMQVRPYLIITLPPVDLNILMPIYFVYISLSAQITFYFSSLPLTSHTFFVGDSLTGVSHGQFHILITLHNICHMVHS